MNLTYNFVLIEMLVYLLQVVALNKSIPTVDLQFCGAIYVKEYVKVS